MEELIQLFRSPFTSPLDIVAFALYIVVFPIYHGLYPYLVRLSPHHTRKGRIDRYRRSWITTLVENRDVMEGAQQTRNLTMVASFLASSALILLGVTGNILLTGKSALSALPGTDVPNPATLETQQVKLYLLVIVFSITFMYFMACLRHLGHFVLIIGADPELIEEEEEVSAVDYITTVINMASNRYTLGTRCLFSALPLFLWLFSTWLFLAITAFSALKFMGLTDFAHDIRRKIQN